MEFPILSLMLAVPLAGAIACLFLGAQSARMVALVATLGDLVLGILLWVNYDIGGAQWQFTERAEIFAGFSYALGIDGIALMLIMLSVFLMPICILASWEAISKRVGEYMSAFLLMEVLIDRRVRRAGPVPVLHLLRSRPHPDVSHHRRMGAATTGSTPHTNSSSTRCSARS